MSKTSVATESICSFLPSRQQANVPPSEESIFVLTANQLHEIILQAVQPLKDELEELEAIVVNQGEKIVALEATQEAQADNELNMLRLIADLRRKKPGKTEISRAEKIEKYLQARPDHKATYETLRGYLGINGVRLNEAIKTLMTQNPGKFSVSKTPGTRSGRTLKMSLRLTL